MIRHQKKRIDELEAKVRALTDIVEQFQAFLKALAEGSDDC